MEVSALVAFAAGLLSFFTPCVVVLVPVFLAGISGTSFAATQVVNSVLHRRIILATVVFGLGFTLVFVSFGALSGFFGRELAQFNKIFYPLVGILIALFGLVQMGVLRIPLLQRTLRIPIQTNATNWSYLKPFLVGLGFGAGWTPCVGPVLAVILLFAGASATVGSGVLYLLLYSLGLLLPYLVFALLITRAQPLAQFLARRSGVIERVGGALLVLLGILLATNFLGRVVSWFYFLIKPVM